jgi:hypothetical protein
MNHVESNQFPLKHAWDALALAQVLIRGDLFYGEPVGIKGRLDAVRFYFDARGVRRLLATMTRSGTLWSQLTIHLALDLAAGGDGEYTYDTLFWPRDGIPYRKLDWRTAMGTDAKVFGRKDGPPFAPTVYYHSHHPYFRIRCARLKDMKIVVVTRSILESLESKFIKYSLDPDLPHVVRGDEDTFPWDKQISDEIEFYNSWGDVLTWHPNILHFTYHQLKATPVDCFRKILEFWGFDIPQWCVEEALRRSSKKAMKVKMSPIQQKTNLQVSYRGKEERGVLAESRKRHIVDRLKRELVHDLGYNYDYDVEYGFIYD